MKNLLSREPVISAALAVLAAAIAVLIAFGVKLTHAQVDALIGLANAAAALVVLVRSKVVPKGAVPAQAVAAAATPILIPPAQPVSVPVVINAVAADRSVDVPVNVRPQVTADQGSVSVPVAVNVQPSVTADQAADAHVPVDVRIVPSTRGAIADPAHVDVPVLVSPSVQTRQAQVQTLLDHVAGRELPLPDAGLLDTASPEGNVATRSNISEA